MANKLEQIEEILKKYNQEHIINFLNNLSEDKKEKLINQMLNIDFEEINELYSKTKKTIGTDLSEILPIAGINPDKLSQEEKEKYIKIGEKLIKEGKFAVTTMAGGQGTRLGHNKPKGTYKIDIGTNGKYLFEIIAENLIKSNNKYNNTIPWYIMTSRENNLDTITFLEENNYFGYPKEYVYIFKQEELPLLDKNGKLLIDKNGLIKEAANGNGGIFKSMKKSGALDDMKKRDIKWIFIGSVDNILLKNVDPLLLGLTVQKNTSIGTKTILKNSPEERVGVFCKKNSKIKVIEYTEIPTEMANLTDDNGELVFGESHIMCNLFSIEALEKVSTKELQYHVALKKSGYLNEKGEYIEPKEPNAYKFEQFIFDSFANFDEILILRGKREEDFAPIKNKTGEDSPKTAKKLYENYWKNI